MGNSIVSKYHIGGTGCDGCVAKVEELLSAVPGVTSVNVDFAKKQAEINSSQAIKTDTFQDALGASFYTFLD